MCHYFEKYHKVVTAQEALVFGTFRDDPEWWGHSFQLNEMKSNRQLILFVICGSTIILYYLVQDYIRPHVSTDKYQINYMFGIRPTCSLELSCPHCSTLRYQRHSKKIRFW